MFKITNIMHGAVLNCEYGRGNIAMPAKIKV